MQERRRNREKKGGMRCQSGTFLVLTVVAAVMVILPLGIYAFELARLHLSHNQLQHATDSAVLAGAGIMFNPSEMTQEEKRNRAKAVALELLKQNTVLGVSLSTVHHSASFATDNPGAGQGSFELLIDESNHLCTANVVVGVQPAFGAFLGINSAPVRASSSAGTKKLAGDIVLVLDISGSMGSASKTLRFERVKVGQSITYLQVEKLSFQGNKINNATFPAFMKGPGVEVPNPDFADFSAGELLNRVANAPSEIKLAALIEAKLGNLENPEVFVTSGASSVLGSFLPPQPGYQNDYQKVALDNIEPLSRTVDAVQGFVSAFNGTEVHMGLITFGRTVSQGEDAINSLSIRTKKDFKMPHVNLSTADDKIETVVSAVETTPWQPILGTRTGPALLAGLNMIQGAGHRSGVERTIILLTDGMPTRPGPFAKAKRRAIEAAEAVGKSGVKLYSIGFFHKGRSKKTGPKVLRRMDEAAGPDAKFFEASSTQELSDILNSIVQGNVALINH